MTEILSTCVFVIFFEYYLRMIRNMHRLRYIPSFRLIPEFPFASYDINTTKKNIPTETRSESKNEYNPGAIV